MSGILVSAVITTHNRKELLRGAILSVLRQTYHPIECIVVDDASVDGTEEYIADLVKDGLVRYIYIDKEHSRGGNHARNMGIEAANGDYVAFLDDDDEWIEDKISNQMKLVSTDVMFVYTGLIREKDFRDRVDRTNETEYPEGDLSKEILVHILTVTSTILVERNLLVQSGCFDENLSYWQEYDLCIRLLQNTDVKCVKEGEVVYRIITADKGRLSNNIEGWEKNVKIIRDKYPDLFAQLSLKDKSRRWYYIWIDGLNRARKSRSIKYLIKYGVCIPIMHPGIIPQVIKKVLARSR